MIKWFIAIIFFSLQAQAITFWEIIGDKSVQPVTTCDSAQEFIVTFEFLRDKGDLAGGGDNALEVAKKVSKGCTGSAKRFINTANLLIKAEIDYKTVLQVASEMALKSDTTASAFFDIFERTYMSSYLDLDAYSSLKIANNLTTLYKGDTSYVADDYSRIVDFCLAKEGMQLPKPRCAKMGALFSSFGQKHKKSVYSQFVAMYQYLQSLKPDQLSIEESLEVMERVLVVNEKAFENFKLAFEYAIKDSGLKGTKKDALKIGLEMAKNSAPQATETSGKY